MDEMRVCPICNKQYSERPAQSRRDRNTYICPECGMLEALDDAREMIGKGLSDEAWEKYKKNYLERVKGRGKHG